MEQPIITWQPAEVARMFGHQPIRMEHRLHTHPLFSRDALADLIERYPEDKYLLVHMGPQGNPRKLWREGKIGKMSGHAVIDAIEEGRLWLNLKHVNDVDPQHQTLLDQVYGEIEDNVAIQPYGYFSGILISSPRAQVYYHFDTMGQNLWQIAGSKKIYIYPATPPFVTDKLVEQITLYHDETSIPYEPWYDQYARVFDLRPGQMVQWDLNAPHRIENDDQLSVSFTTEFFTKQIRRHVLMMSGNGLVRQVGINPSRTTKGPAYYAKLAVFAAAKKAGMLNARRTKPVVFRLSEGVPAE